MQVAVKRFRSCNNRKSSSQVIVRISLASTTLLEQCHLWRCETVHEAPTLERIHGSSKWF